MLNYEIPKFRSSKLHQQPAAANLPRVDCWVTDLNVITKSPIFLPSDDRIKNVHGPINFYSESVAGLYKISLMKDGSIQGAFYRHVECAYNENIWQLSASIPQDLAILMFERLELYRQSQLAKAGKASDSNKSIDPSKKAA